MSQQTELIVETIKSCPILHDSPHPDCKNVRSKNKVWNSRAETIGETNLI